MIDHVLGRPSVQFRKIQVFAVVCFWSLYLHRGDKHGPPLIRRISQAVSKRLTAWQTLVITLVWLYLSRNFAKIVGLECPEPLANLYSRSYFRATWITTALDAGFWTAMKIRRKWLRDLASIVFTGFYLLAAEQADEKVRKVRGTLTVEHLRVSWEKLNTPYLSLVTRLTRPKFMRYPPRKVLIPRPPESSYKDPVTAWLYFDEPLSAIGAHTKVILDIPGGGFVAMNPRSHDDKLIAWAGRTGLPVLSLDYRKAPEFPYPFALNECYDVYHTLIASRGRCIGLATAECPRIVITGDSAGGNLATGLVLMILQSSNTDPSRWSSETTLPCPEGLILIYPGLDMNIGNWMTDEQMALIQDRRMRRTNRNILRRKSEDYYKLAETPHPSDDEEQSPSPPNSPSRSHTSTSEVAESVIKSPIEIDPKMAHTSYQNNVEQNKASVVASKSTGLKTRLAVSSMISYFNDRILTPEMMRAMIILYVGPHNRPDFTTDHLLSPLLAPEALLAKFPKTYFLTGERDPLVDDTVIFAGRLRQAKHNLFVQRKELGLVKVKDEFDEKDHVEVTLVPGISHGFFQFVSVFPEGWKHIFRCARWIEDVFGPDNAPIDWASDHHHHVSADSEEAYVRHHRRTQTESSADEDRPLTMTSSSKTSSSKEQPKQNGGKHLSRERLMRSKKAKSLHQRPSAKRQISIARLNSEEDLLGRRMMSVAGGLMGMAGMNDDS